MREPFISPGGITKILMVVALLFVAEWVYYGVESVVKPPIRAVFVATGLVDQKDLPPLHQRDRQRCGAQWRPDCELPAQPGR